MTDRPLTLHERALIAAAVAFCTVRSTGFHEDDDRLLRRLADVVDAIQSLSLKDQFVVTSGPLEWVYGDACDLIAAHRDKAADQRQRARHAQYLACQVFRYFELRSVLAQRALGLPDHVPDPEKSVTVF
jgi:hypothetical protein